MSRKLGRPGGPTVRINCLVCDETIVMYYSKFINIKENVYCSMKCRSLSPEYKEAMSRAGKKRAKQDMYGKNNPNWRGGLSSGRHKLQSQKRYKEWRKAVYERDNYTCIECGVPGNGKNLQADHIKPYALYPELVFDLSNGRTLCIDCHRQTDTYGWKLFNDIKWRNKCRA